MTCADAQEAIKLLSAEFRIIPPYLSWSNRAKRGWAFTWGKHGNRIAVGPRCWRGPEATLLHEFAHILAWRRTGSHIKSPGHNEFFWRMLEKVVLAWYGNFDAYPWDTEYLRGQQFAGKAKAKKEGKMTRREAYRKLNRRCAGALLDLAQIKKIAGTAQDCHAADRARSSIDNEIVKALGGFNVAVSYAAKKFPSLA